MDEHSWSDRLSRLDLDRECTAGASEDSCWLCDHLEDWNFVLNAVQLSLVEWQPGKLSLCTQALENPVDLCRNRFPYDTAFITAWLPRKHWCVEALNLSGCHLRPDKTAVPGPFPGLRPSGLHRISITGNLWAGNDPFDWAPVLDALGPVEQLESLACTSLTVSDSMASKLAQLLSANAGSVTRLCFFRSTIGSHASDILVGGISKCKILRELRFYAHLSQNGLTQFTNWLQSRETLEILQLTDDTDEDEDRTMACVGRERNKGVLATVADLLRKSTSLNEFHYQSFERSAITGVLEALETNTVLRHLVLAGYKFAQIDIGNNMGVSLKSMLAKNRGLHLLTFVDYSVDYDTAVLISEGLQENKTLKYFCVSASELSFPAEQAFCNALKKNTVLQLQFNSSGRSAEERHALSAELERNRWYSRVRIQWSDSDVAGLSASLLDRSMCLTDLCFHTHYFSDESFSTLCNALSSSPQLQDLTVLFSDVAPAHVASLHEVLMENKSLRRVSLYEVGYDARGSAAVVSQGLCFNDSVAELLIKFEDVDTMSAELVALLLETNETLSKVTLKCEHELEPERVDAILVGLLQNKFVTDFTIHHIRSNVDYLTACGRAAVQRNVTCLHRAVRFVLGRNLEKVCAEAFELFENKASLVTCVMSASGMSQAEAERAVKSARKFVRANYFIVTRVVCQKIECYAGNGTQIDQLNADCWLTITKYLNVLDVVDK